MNLLLDTHIFLWWRANEPRLGAEARTAISDADVVFVSVASAWEVAIKMSLGKLRLEGRFGDGVDQSGFRPLPITFEHAEHVSSLPPHHRDPFDRLLIAQALSEGLTVVTGDRKFKPYKIPVVWA